MRSLALVLSLSMLSCAGGPRARVASAVDRGDLEEALAGYEELRRSEGADPDVLARIAGLVLLRAARGEDDAARRAAIGQLALAGTAGEPLLRRLADDAEHRAARLAALEVLARRGHDDARYVLRAMADDDDLEVVAASVLGMDPALDRALLIELLGSTHAGVRAAAARALSPTASEAEVLRALAQTARVDPEASVRAAATRSLGSGGGAAIDALSERLSDADGSVRMAAVGALMQADVARGLAAIGPLLAIAPSPAGIEAARLVAQLDGEEHATETANARLFLRRALEAGEASLRSQAGVALAGLPADREAPLDAVAEALAREIDAEVRLSLARALLRGQPEPAREALRALLEAEGMPRVQAAAILAADGDAPARAILAEVLASDAGPILRRTAARAIARDAMRPDEVRAALTDEIADVRVYAAGGILAAAAAS